MTDDIERMIENTALTFTIVQITDSHLFADVNGCHHGANVYQNLIDVLTDITKQQETQRIDALIFTGDLTQDHTEQSYQNFALAFAQVPLNIPCYYLPGNHDEVDLLDKYLIPAGFSADKTITSSSWQLLLLNSKSATPAGFFNQSAFEQLSSSGENRLVNQFIFMHHHPIDVGFSIDRHGLINPVDFWLSMNQSPSIKGIACGHVHQAIDIFPSESGYSKPLYTCPATSMQFDPNTDGVRALSITPAYRLLKFFDSGQITTDIIEVYKR